MTDVWVCGNCHSLNRQRANRCYKCGAEQKTAATGEMATLRQEQAIATRQVIPYRPAAALGLAAAIFLLGLAAVSIAAAIQSAGNYPFLIQQLDLFLKTGQVDRAAFVGRLQDVDTLNLVRLGIIVPTLLFFAAWLSRVVANVPALGGGIPGTSPYRAFVATLIPVVNFRTVPGTIQDVLYRLDPTAGGVFMIAIAWIGLVGSWFVSAFGGRYLVAKMTFDARNATTTKELVESLRTNVTALTAVDVATGVLVAVGALVLILVMIRIERRSTARDREVRAAAGV